MLLTRAALNLQVESLGVKRTPGSDPGSLRKKPERQLILNLYRFRVKHLGFIGIYQGSVKGSIRVREGFIKRQGSIRVPRYRRTLNPEP